MNLILLSGASLKNKDWVEQVEAKLKPHFTSTQVVYYDHWSNGGEELDQEKELPKLEAAGKAISDYVIFAKSAGSWLTLRAIYEGKVNPTKLIIVGPAWNWAANNQLPIATWVKALTMPVMFIDKSQDPSLAFEKLEQLVKEYGIINCKLVEIPGNTHSYEDIDCLEELVNQWLPD